MSTRRLLLVWALLLAGIFCLAQQPTKAYWQSRDSNYNIAISGGGGGVTFNFADSVGIAANATTSVPLTFAAVGTPSGAEATVCNYGGGGVSVSTITYGAQTLTKKSTSGLVGVGFSAELWSSDGLTLASGTQTVTATLSGTGGFTVLGVVAVSGGSTVTTFSSVATPTTANSAAPSIGVVTGSSSELAVSGACNGGTFTYTAGQTLRWGTTSAPTIEGAGSTSPGTGGTVNLTWTQSTADTWAEVGGSFH